MCLLFCESKVSPKELVYPILKLAQLYSNKNIAFVLLHGYKFITFGGSGGILVAQLYSFQANSYRTAIRLINNVL